MNHLCIDIPPTPSPRNSVLNSVFVCSGCHNKGPQTGCLRQQKCIVPQFWSHGVTDPRCQHTWFFLMAVRENWFSLLAFGGLLATFGIPWLLPYHSDLRLHFRCSSVRLIPNFPLWRGYQSRQLGAHPTPV